jgi:hypothetical protein
MTKAITVLAVVAAASAASGCASIGRAVGAAKVSPDEFRVVTQAPLTLPPDYSLRPPRPGEPRPQELQPTEEARAALFGQDVAASASPGERTLVTEAHADAVDPGIRDTVDFESQNIVRRNRGFVDRLLAFGSGEADSSQPLNAEAEQQRLAEQEQIRRLTGGGEVVIQRDSGGIKLPGT